ETQPIGVVAMNCPGGDFATLAITCCWPGGPCPNAISASPRLEAPSTGGPGPIGPLIGAARLASCQPPPAKSWRASTTGSALALTPTQTATPPPAGLTESATLSSASLGS